jgi:hypothetical protein
MQPLAQTGTRGRRAGEGYVMATLRWMAWVMIAASCGAPRQSASDHGSWVTCQVVAECTGWSSAVACSRGLCVDQQGRPIAAQSAPVSDGGADPRARDSGWFGTRADAGTGAKGGCRTEADCADATNIDTNVVCVAPYQPDPPSGCGGIAPWCGTCNCPLQPTPPLGTHQTCQTDADCPQSAPAGGRFAGVCGPDRSQVSSTKVCQQCITDADCSGALPVCGNEAEAYQTTYPVCVECRVDSDCPAGRSHCVAQPGLGGKCRACASDADCSDGVCSDIGCVSACEKDADCPDPLAPCSAHKRCEAITCASNAGCPAYSQCAAGTCGRMACTTDRECGNGVCVAGACYPLPGHCFSQFLAP